MLWRRYNVGASSQSEPGEYFSWGNSDGHVRGSGYDFSQEVYNTTPGSSIATDLDLSNDMARNNLGAPWRLPTNVEYQELYDNCKSIWTTSEGIPGLLLTSNINGQVLFFPAAGFYDGLTLKNRNSAGYYWSSKYASTGYAVSFGFNSVSISQNGTNKRHSGFTVRAVMEKQDNRSVVPPTPEDEPKDEETPTTEENIGKDER